MKTQRVDLLNKIGFTSIEIAKVEAFVEQLEEKNLWDTMQKLAFEVMSVHPCGNALRTNLEKVEKLELEAGIHRYSLDLLLIIECALILKEDFEKKTLEDSKYTLEIYYDTMKDITYKVHECQDVYGVLGIFVGFWYDGFFDMTRFALGRLQFEIMPLWLSKAVEVNGCTLEKGMAAINMHIPSSGPLTPFEVDESLQKASEFFKCDFEGRTEVFVMSSWLLDEDLMALLPEGNIKEFVTKFQVVNTNKSDYFDDGWRVYGNAWCFDRNTWRDGVENLPRNTRLQRVIADYLQRGGNFGYGYGVRML